MKSESLLSHQERFFFGDTIHPKMLAAASEKHQVAAEIKLFARRLGFDLVGIAPADAIDRADYFRAWLDSDQHGEMHYLSDRFDERVDPKEYLPGAKSVICVAVNYNAGDSSVTNSAIGKIARYARGDDYHKFIKDRLHDLADWMRATWPGTHTKCGVDTAPIMEKPLAARAGIGWQGKNTCVIHPQVGSWLLLGEILTTMELPIDQPAIDRCGTCRRCIDACPTGALTGPYQLDARKCISYLTIEHTNPIDLPLQHQMGSHLIGCDICQEVCPFNQDVSFTNEPSFRSRFLQDGLEPDEVLRWEQADYSGAFRQSALKRVKLPVLKRNAQIVRQNTSSTLA